MLSKELSSTIFWVFGMTWPGIDPQSPGLPGNTLTIMLILHTNTILFYKYNLHFLRYESLYTYESLRE